MGWGSDMLTVEAQSSRRAKEVADQLAALGFHVVEEEDDAYAGIVNLSPDSAAIHSRIASFDVARPNDFFLPLLFGVLSLVLIPFPLPRLDFALSPLDRHHNGARLVHGIHVGRNRSLGWKLDLRTA